VDTGLRGKKGLITGGSTGIGLGIAKTLAKEGASLVLAGLDPAPEAVEELRQSGSCAFLKIDVSEERSVCDMVQRAIDMLGGLDLFINNAAGAWHQSVTQITSEAFSKTLSINLAACVWAGREVARYMIPKRSGSVLIVGSTVRFCPSYTEASYRISKMGLKMYMETLAIELAPFGIRVNMLTPGHFSTKLTAGLSLQKETTLRSNIPLRRFGQPAEIGPTAAFLLSDLLSPYTTGAEFVVDGGLSLRPLPMLSEDEILGLNQRQPITRT
jgi:NAD(P)-dependent dehydrogenase (short-subunit alcohol dehydrogenase family)